MGDFSAHVSSASGTARSLFRQGVDFCKYIHPRGHFGAMIPVFFTTCMLSGVYLNNIALSKRYEYNKVQRIGQEEDF